MFDFLKRKKEVLKEEDKLQKGTLLVEVIVPDSQSLTESLGITTERSRELAALVHSSYMTSTNLGEAISKVSRECVHANELFFTSHVMSDMHSKNIQSSMMMDMMRGKFGGK